MGRDSSRMRLGGGMVQRELARWWWVPLVAAACWFVIAWLVMRANYASLATVGVLVGVALFVSAANESALAVVMRGGWAVLHVALAVLLFLGGVWAFVRPVNTFFALASVLGLLILLQGAFTLARGIAMRGVTPHWWLEVTGGSLMILLGIWIDTSDRIWHLGARAAFILLWVGFMAIFRGISDIFLAFSLRGLARDDDTSRRWPETRVVAAPPVTQPRIPESSAGG